MKFRLVGPRAVRDDETPRTGRLWIARLPWHQIVPLVIGLYCALLLLQHLREVDLSAVWMAARSVTLDQWMAALAATAASFWALGRYDVHVHAHCRTGVDAPRAARSGMCAIAISQVTGLAALVGGVVRWKLLRPIGIGTVTTVTLSVSLIFFLGWLLTLALAALLPGAPLPGWVAAFALLALTALLALSVLRPPFPGFSGNLPIPSVLHILKLSGLALVDLVAAGLALHVLLPPEIMVGFATFFPVFLIAFGAGLYSGTPGGVGPFELTLIAFLPQVPAADLLAAILVFRVAYYALPACLALGVLIRNHVTRNEPAIQSLAIPERPISGATRAETALVHHNGGVMARFSDTTWATVDTGQTLVCLLDPAQGHAADALPHLRARAAAEGRFALLYKLSGRSAAAVVAAGWHSLRISDEARLRPDRFTLNTPERRQLRRKLRQAEKAGITVAALDPVADFAEMARVARAWRDAHGRERGISMGRFSAEAILNQRILGAFRDKRLVAFATFHESPEELCLDLMRLTPAASDGAMHALVHAAIVAAGKAEIPWISLAAAPAAPDEAGRTAHRWLLHLISARGQGAGLRRFKASFAPTWSARYVAAPGRMHLLLTLLDMARAVHWPDRIQHNMQQTT